MRDFHVLYGDDERGGERDGEQDNERHGEDSVPVAHARLEGEHDQHVPIHGDHQNSQARREERHPECRHYHVTQDSTKNPFVVELVMQLNWQVEHAQRHVCDGQVGDEYVGHCVQLLEARDYHHDEQVGEEAENDHDGVGDDDGGLPARLGENRPVSLPRVVRV